MATRESRRRRRYPDGRDRDRAGGRAVGRASEQRRQAAPNEPHAAALVRESALDASGDGGRRSGPFRRSLAAEDPDRGALDGARLHGRLRRLASGLPGGDRSRAGLGGRGGGPRGRRRRGEAGEAAQEARGGAGAVPAGGDRARLRRRRHRAAGGAVGRRGQTLPPRAARRRAARRCARGPVRGPAADGGVGGSAQDPRGARAGAGRQR